MELNVRDFKKFDWDKITIKYNHWFAPMIPFIKSKNRMYGKVIGKTIYFSRSKEFMTQLNDNGDFKYNHIIRHEFQHVYQQHQDGFLKFWLIYNMQWFLKLFTNYLNPYNAYLAIPYEVEARDTELQPLFHKEIGVLLNSND